LENADLIQKLLEHAPRVIPSFAAVSPDDVRKLACAVAYLLRPDNILRGERPLVDGVVVPKIYGEDGKVFHPRNDPQILTPQFELQLEQDPHRAGGEFFRCFRGAFGFLPRICPALRDPDDTQAAFALADLVAYLLDPRDLKDYRYTTREIRRFNNGVLRALDPPPGSFRENKA
jgi:hypothetical protein